MATLNSYITDVRRLVHDANATYWTNDDLTSYVNRAVKQRDIDTSIRRELVVAPLIQGVSFYNLQNYSLRAIDIVSLTIYYSNLRVVMEQLSYSEMVGSSGYLSILNYTDVPRAFARYGQMDIVLGPVPNQPYTTEWDLLVFSPELVLPTDDDGAIYPWTDPVPFMAASFAKFEMQQYDEADKFREMYDRRIVEMLGGARGMMNASPYFQYGSRYNTGQR